MEIETYLIGALASVFLSLLGVAWLLIRSRAAMKRYRARFGPAIDLDDEVRDLQSQVRSVKAEHAMADTELRDLVAKLGLAREASELAEYGYRTPRDLYEDSEECGRKLKDLRFRQKSMLKDKAAAICSTEWEVSGSKARGKQMTARYLRLMLRAFNGECDALVSKVTYRNIETSEARVERAFEAINKLGESQACSIREEFHGLKRDELLLAHHYAELKQEEKEEQRRIKEEMREEQRAAKELAKAREVAEDEEDRRLIALDDARKELAAATGEEQALLNSKIAELESLLAQAHEKSERARSRAQDTKCGHVYIISNLGAFGEDIFKIGMTRRLDPQDRVKELGDASVPFTFDVHAMIFSNDAPGLEAALHRQFDERRVNMVNRRKEFFSVKVSELASAVKELDGDIVFTRQAEAADYFKSQQLRKERVSPSALLEEISVI